MKLTLGTVIDVKGRGLATAVHYNLDGHGIVWGDQTIDVEAIPKPEAMLRDKYPGAEIECVGEDYTIVREPKI